MFIGRPLLAVASPCPPTDPGGACPAIFQPLSTVLTLSPGCGLVRCLTPLPRRDVASHIHLLLGDVDLGNGRDQLPHPGQRFDRRQEAAVRPVRSAVPEWLTLFDTIPILVATNFLPTNINRSKVRRWASGTDSRSHTRSNSGVDSTPGDPLCCRLALHTTSCRASVLHFQR